MSHLLLVHNSSEEWNLTINPPLWTIAVEWQIYALFPLLALLWRRAGLLPLLSVALTLGVAQAMMRGRVEVLTYPLSYTWFLGLFGLGMAGAAIAFSRRRVLRRLRERLPWPALGALWFAAAVAVKLVRERFGGLPEWPADTLLGFAIVCFLVYLSRAQERPRGQRPLLLRQLSAGPLVWIGHISYSLYLTHAPVLVALAILVGWLGMPGLAAHAAVLIAGVPLALGAAYLFFIAFERPFLVGRPRFAADGMPYRRTIEGTAQ
jgi:peptidoglycan/LPS O-acetylase OafA/YrhL